MAPAVAKAAIDSGLARVTLDLSEYTLRLKAKQHQGRDVLSHYYCEAKRAKSKKVAFPEGVNPRVLKAAMMAKEEGIAEPILLGVREKIESVARELELSLEGVEIIDPTNDRRHESYLEFFYQQNQRRGVTRSDADREIRRCHLFANTMLARGEVDGLICGVDRYFPSMVKPILETIGLKPGAKTAAGLYIVSIRGRILFFADTAINTSMTSEKLAHIAVMAAEFAKSMNIEPHVALLSYSNFGSVKHPDAYLVRDAATLARELRPDLQIDGEMQADTAVMNDILRTEYPTSHLQEAANVLIFPDMQSGNIAYKLLQRLGGARVIGPVILGLNAPAYVMQRHAGVDEIFNMITVAVAQASFKTKKIIPLAEEKERRGIVSNG